MGGELTHGQVVTFDGSISRNKIFRKKTVITLDGKESAVMVTSCMKELFLGQTLSYSVGQLVLVGFSTQLENETTLCPELSTTIVARKNYHHKSKKKSKYSAPIT